MVSSESSNTMARLILGAIVAVTATGIIIGLFSGIAGDSVSSHQGEFQEFVNDVNQVCDDKQGSSSGYVQIEDYRINRSDNNRQKLMLVNANEQVEDSMEAECPILKEFTISTGYRIDRVDSRDAVEVSERFTGSQSGGLQQ